MRTLTWNVGDVPSWNGHNNAGQRGVFSGFFSPNLTQVGETPVLVNKAVVEARRVH